ncbi:hypothetical protein C8R43DRAFT_1121243 [Mycena crocata]|nr:hypothetical protein C8R43DRAFT_1121243 [Mycena crocata]
MSTERETPEPASPVLSVDADKENGKFPSCSVSTVFLTQSKSENPNSIEPETALTPDVSENTVPSVHDQLNFLWMYIRYMLERQRRLEEEAMLLAEELRRTREFFRRENVERRVWARGELRSSSYMKVTYQSTPSSKEIPLLNFISSSIRPTKKKMSLVERENRPSFDIATMDIVAVRARVAELQAAAVVYSGPSPRRRRIEAREAEERAISAARDVQQRQALRWRLGADVRAGPLPPPGRRPGGLHIIRRPAPNSIAIIGWRMPREDPLKHEDLWVGGIGPTEQLPLKKMEHHKCGICRFVKSHPVSYLCGHSHCYVCIRLWLERRWSCPECVTEMWMAPFRQFAEEASIVAAYPEWNDESEVSYNWDGLTFPRRPRIVYAPDSD